MQKLSAVAPLLVLLAAISSGCQCSSPPPATTAALLPDGERCNTDGECVSGLCAGLPNEPAICRKTCASGCNPLEVCTSFGIGSGGKLRAGCVAEKLGLCQACSTNSDCPYPADVCLSIGGASFCGRDCAFDDQCPDGYVCSDALAADGTPATRQCIPKSATCECLPTSVGQTRPCEVTNAYGTCVGNESCDPARGFGGCDARVPAPETCDGIDDDCNGKVDDAIDPITCGVGECRVTVSGCEGGRVPLCTPKQGSAEVCNGKDDDCDTEIDEDFDLTADVQNCGACGTVCTAKNGTPKCAASACAIDRCNAGYGDCDGQVATGCEASLNTDVNHCGACNSPCNLAHANPRCTGGKCAIDSCEPGWLDADKNPATGCEYQCTPTNGGIEACDGIDNDCDGLTDEDFNLATNKDHCGVCNNKCTVANGAAGCNMGQCVVASCNSGWGNCDGAQGNGCEANLNTDAQNCGLCGRGCSVANGVPACTGGQCGIGSCNQPFNDCDQSYASGCESNKTTDLSNCGSCGNSCPNRPNSTRTCTPTGCAYSCTAPFQDCDGQPTNGCESNRQTDVNNCGSCGNTCPTRPNATSICTPTRCSFTCFTGFADCDGNPANGCEVDTQTSVSHCGACQNSCPSRANASRTCSNGNCAFSCSSTYSDCNGQAGDGCEINTNSDVNHCGGCNAKCPDRPNAASFCSSGSCGFNCTTGFNDCDGSPINGCESNKATDIANCGSCGNVCPARPNASPLCTATGCSFSCNPGFADCDGVASNGCEVNTTNNASHCGQCNNACPVGGNQVATCSNSQCNSSCTAPFADCTSATGCETNTSNSVSHCGGCNVSCPTRPNATRTCTGGTCGYTCSSSYLDCNGSATDGCEVNRNGDPLNCGTCGNICPTRTGADRICSSGTCSYICQSGRADCDGLTTNGCERILNNRGAAPQCGSVTDLGSISGDSGNGFISRTNFAEGTYKFRVTENNSGCIYLSAIVKLISPPGLDYDLYLYTGSCGGNTVQVINGGAGGTEQVNTCNRDSCWGEDSGYDVWFEIVYKSGSACGDWRAEVSGNVYVALCE